MKIFYWIVRSSKDSSKWSLTLKSGLVWGIALLGAAHVSVAPDSAEAITNLAVQTVEWLAGLVALYGGYRKLIRSFQGKNDVMESRVWE